MAHADVEAAEQAAEAVRVPGVAGAGLGVAIALAGTIGAPLLIPCRPAHRRRRRHDHPRAAPAAASPRPPPSSGRRSSGPACRATSGSTSGASTPPSTPTCAAPSRPPPPSSATPRWPGWSWSVPSVDVHKAKALEAEVQAYHTALRNLGGAADEIEQLRDRARRARRAGRRRRPDGAGPGLRRRTASPRTTSPTRRPSTRRVAAAIQRGRAARLQGELEMVEAGSRTPPASWARTCSSSASTPASSTPASARSSGPSPGPASARRPAPTPARAPSIEAELVDPPGDGSPAQAPRVGDGQPVRGRRPRHRRARGAPREAARAPRRGAARGRRRAPRRPAGRPRAPGDGPRGPPRRPRRQRRSRCGRRHPAAPARPPHPGRHRRAPRRPAARRARRGVPPGARRAQVGSARPAPPPVGAPPADLPDRRPLRRRLGEPEGAATSASSPPNPRPSEPVASVDPAERARGRCGRARGRPPCPARMCTSGRTASSFSVAGTPRAIARLGTVRLPGTSAPGAHQALVLEHRAVEHDGARADERAVADRAALEVHEVADDALVADAGRGRRAWCAPPCRPGSTCGRRSRCPPGSPRSTAVGHTDDSGPMVTSPITTASGWM